MITAWVDRFFRRGARAVAGPRSQSTPGFVAPRNNECEADIQAGMTALGSGNPLQAIEHFTRVLSVVHDHAGAHYGLGLAHMRLGQCEDANDAFIMALHFSPDMHRAHYALAMLDRGRGRLKEAIAAIDRASEIDSRNVDYLNFRGALLVDNNDIGAAIECFERALALDPGYGVCHSNLGYLLFRDYGEYKRGAAHIREALRLDPDNRIARCNYTMVLNHEGRMEETIVECDRLLAADGRLDEARLNRALASLMLGRFDSAWEDYEARKRVRSNYVARTIAVPEWRGEDLAARTMLICAEQGLGDEIMFASCFADIAARAGRLVLECSPRLRTLFERSFPFASVIDTPEADRYGSAADSVRRADFQLSAGSLPLFFRRSSESFPRHGGYLLTDSLAQQHWRERLDALGEGLKVGLSWRGGMASTRRNLRSIELARMAPILSVPGCHFVDLQYGDTAEERSSLERETEYRLHHWPEAIDDLDQAAALIARLDLVISVCTAAVHLTGGIGRPVWVLVPSHPEWRYMREGGTIPWYPSARLFRQKASDDWRPVIAEVAAELASYHSRSVA